MRLKFSELFEGPAYSARCTALSGSEVEIPGFIAEAHDGSAQLLVAEPGGCPHCSQVPAVALPGFRVAAGAGAVTLRGTLSYGFRMDGAGNATFLRLENARLATGIPS